MTSRTATLKESGNALTQFTVADYLLHRLGELGIDTIFGVPGDYVLEFICAVTDGAGPAWVGNCNELNAAYAADGYARVKGAAALVVTAGVGDLGAAGGVAGAYAENAPVVVISGVPGSGNGPLGRPLVHHSLGDGDFGPFQRIYSEITTAQAILTADNAPGEIDRMSRQVWLNKRPVYISLPADVAVMPVTRPERRLDLHHDPSDPHELNDFLAHLAEATQRSARTALLADIGIRQFGYTAPLNRLLSDTGVPWATTWAAAWDLDTSALGYLGIYFGTVGGNDAVSHLNAADLLIRVGCRCDEFGTDKADPSYRGGELVDIHPLGATIGDRQFPTLRMPDVIAGLRNALGSHRRIRRDTAPMRAQPPFVAEADTRLTQDRFWERFANYIRQGDAIVVDTGSCNLGLRSIKLPSGVSVLTQNMWSSIGWSLPALLGSQLADSSSRHILLIGDGAFALTAQEISTMLRSGLAPLLVVLNNEGYLVEDLAGGRRMVCNDIWTWKYSALADVFDGHGAYKPLGLRVSNERELDCALAEAERAQANGRLVLLEVVLDRSDAPRLMRAIAAAASGGELGFGDATSTRKHGQTADDPESA
jgi:indolepyruvate decarboxylase